MERGTVKLTQMLGDGADLIDELGGDGEGGLVGHLDRLGYPFFGFGNAELAGEEFGEESIAKSS